LKYLIIGLGNIGAEYVQTRHNVGFEVVESIAKSFDVTFSNGKKAAIAEARHKGKSIILIKPTTYMNLSGEAVRYWMQELKISLENTLIVTDDLALPFGTLRLRPGGSAAGHNGLTNIIECLNTDKFGRLRFGIGNDYPKGRQVEHVLGQWSKEEEVILQERIKIAEEIVKSFTLIGIQNTMNAYNNK